MAPSGQTAAVIGEWAVTEELNQRVGCGLSTALTLPLWFLLLGLAVASNLALLVAASLFVVSAAAGPVLVRRSRRLPRTIRLEGPTDGSTELVLISRSGQSRRPVAALRRLDMGTSVGPWPIRLEFADGSRLRLPAEIEDIGTFLEELQSRCPQLVMTGFDRLDQHHDQVPVRQRSRDCEKSGADLAGGRDGAPLLDGGEELDGNDGARDR